MIAIPYRVFELKIRAGGWQQTLVVWPLVVGEHLQTDREEFSGF